jgi:hypothetical protein
LGFLFFSLLSQYNSLSAGGGSLRQYCLLIPNARNLKNANLFPKMLWWQSSPCGDLVELGFQTALEHFGIK